MEHPVVATVREVQRRFGVAALRCGDDPLSESGRPTGIPLLDQRLCPGGLPRGRVSVLAGGLPGTSGRLTLLAALLAVASRGGGVAYLDLAGSFDPGFAADLGTDLNSCLVLRPREGDPATGLMMCRALVAAGVDWVGIALGERSRPAGGQRWDHALAALAEAAWQRRAVVCVSAPAPLDRGLAYAASMTLGCRALGWQEAHGDVVGLRVAVETIKSKLGGVGARGTLLLRYPRPFATAEVVAMPAVVDLPVGERPAVAGRGRQRGGSPAIAASRHAVAR